MFYTRSGQGGPAAVARRAVIQGSEPNASARRSAAVAPVVEVRRASSIQAGAAIRKPSTLVDVEVPLERDLDGDPAHEDHVRLVSSDGAFVRALKASDPAVLREEGSPLLTYVFEDVPPGAYRVDVMVGARWYPVVASLPVSSQGLPEAGAAIDGASLGTPEEDVVEDELDDEVPEDWTDFNHAA